jgi:hypothetical protein
LGASPKKRENMKFQDLYNQANEQIYCVEYSECSNQHGMFPFHTCTVGEAIRSNIEDMYHNNRRENKWQIVFIGSQRECSDAIEHYFNTLSLAKKKRAQQTLAPDALPGENTAQ